MSSTSGGCREHNVFVVSSSMGCSNGGGNCTLHYAIGVTVISLFQACAAGFPRFFPVNGN